MSISAMKAAQRLVELSEGTLSNLQLNKILYIAHMVQLGRTGGADGLVSDDFEAWDLGPVAPDVYHAAKSYGSQSVKHLRGTYKPVGPTPYDALLNDVLERARRMSAGELVAMTHRSGGAWALSYRPGSRGLKIRTENIVNEYNARIGGPAPVDAKEDAADAGCAAV